MKFSSLRTSAGCVAISSSAICLLATVGAISNRPPSGYAEHYITEHSDPSLLRPKGVTRFCRRQVLIHYSLTQLFIIHCGGRRPSHLPSHSPAHLCNTSPASQSLMYQRPHTCNTCFQLLIDFLCFCLKIQTLPPLK